MNKKLLSIICAVIALVIGQMTFEAHYKPSFYNRFREFPSLNHDLIAKDFTLTGSSSYVIGHLNTKFSRPHHPVYVVDLQEKDTQFIQGYPQHWFGYDKNLSDKKWYDQYKYYSRRLVLTGRLHHPVTAFEEAKDLVTGQNLLYVSLLQTRKKVPDQEFINKFISFLRSLPDHAHIHVYCREGKGRTSIVLLMIDIWRTQGKIPLHDLVKIHHDAGSENLLDTTIWENGTYTPEMLQARKEFIEQFYQDVRQGRYPISV